MKILSVLAVVITLSGCAAYLKFDNVEYQNYVTVKVGAQIGKENCSRSLDTVLTSVFVVRYATEQAYEYQRNRTEVPELIAASEELVKLARELDRAYAVSHVTHTKFYCEAKFHNIATAAGKIAAAVAKKE